MPIDILPMRAEHLPAVAEFSRRTWERPEDEAFYRWRYLDAPLQITWIALRGAECVGTLSAFCRPYLFGGMQVSCLETADWFCLPELRGSGVGVRLMRRAMEDGRPILAVGGRGETCGLLPRLGWQELGQATHFSRPLTGEAVTRAMHRQVRLPRALGVALGWPARRWFAHRRLSPIGGQTERPVSLGMEAQELCRSAAGCGTVPLPLPEQLAWLTRGFAAHRFVPLYFRAAGELVGFSLLRLDVRHGWPEASLLELFARRTDPQALAWMVAETLACAAGLGATTVRGTTACPYLLAALRVNRSLSWFPEPIHYWGAGREAPPGPFHLGSNIGDAAIVPYPREWQGPAALA